MTLDINIDAKSTHNPNICSNAIAIKKPKTQEITIPILVVLISSRSVASGLYAGLYISYEILPPATKQYESNVDISVAITPAKNNPNAPAGNAATIMVNKAAFESTSTVITPCKTPAFAAIAKTVTIQS